MSDPPEQSQEQYPSPELKEPIVRSHAEELAAGGRHAENSEGSDDMGASGPNSV